MDLVTLRNDLLAEQQALDDVVAQLSEEAWFLPTPSERWSVADQIGHLSYFDDAAVLAIIDPAVFRAKVGELWAIAGAGEQAMDELTLGADRRMASAEVLTRWRGNRQALADASLVLDDEQRVDWYGPAMSAKSFLTARLMETWAHGQDIVDALRITRPATDRLIHIARLGYLTRAWSYSNRGLAPPTEPVRVELVSPSGEVWRFGPEDAVETVAGGAEEFCLVVTQRRHPDDTELTATPLGVEWLAIAQAFAGPATLGPTPRT